MNLLAESIQPLTSWLNQNPTWAGLITFLISFSESLAIVGSIIPGSVTMTAIGIMVGSGVISAEITFISAILGAIAGDSISYALGYHFKDRLFSMWPFRKHPYLLDAGNKFFEAHGGKSVLIGRFVGPLRAITPLIAGMMAMPQLKFLMANVISAIGWSFLYILPGVFIGAATMELSPETATRLLIYVLVGLSAIWILGKCGRWFAQLVSQSFEVNATRYWQYLATHPRLKSFSKYLIYEQDLSDASQFKLFLTALSFLIFFSLISLLIQLTHFTGSINSACFHFIDSIRTPGFDRFFILIHSLASLSSMLWLYFALGLYFLYFNYSRLGKVWYANGLICLTVSYLLTHALSPVTLESFYQPFSSPYPTPTLIVATSATRLLFFMLNAQLHVQYKSILRISYWGGLFFIGLAELYLVKTALFTVIASISLGLSVASFSILVLRSNSFSLPRNRVTLLLSSALLALSTFFMATWHPVPLPQSPYHVTSRMISLKKWWNQDTPVLPHVRFNRFGHPIATLNLQWLGDINKIEAQLVRQNWIKPNLDSFLNWLERLGNGSKSNQLPLLTHLLFNRKPDLIVYKRIKKGHPILILRLWHSPVQIKEQKQSLWIGSLHYHLSHQHPWHSLANSPSEKASQTSLNRIITTVTKGFKKKTISATSQKLIDLKYESNQTVYLIRPN